MCVRRKPKSSAAVLTFCLETWGSKLLAAQSVVRRRVKLLTYTVMTWSSLRIALLLLLPSSATAVLSGLCTEQGFRQDCNSRREPSQ